MSIHTLPGTMNGPVAGIVMRDLVRRVTEMAQRELFRFTAHDKTVDYKEGRDVVTTIDLAAQDIYERLLRECFPDYGIVGEERGLRIPCAPDLDIWFSVDPVDGTKALERLQSHGISTMIALIHNGVVIAAAIGDIMTGEVFYHRPGSTTVHRLARDHQVVDLLPNNKPLGDQYLLARENPLHLTPGLTALCVSNKQDKRGLFRDLEVSGGSIGCMYARLWKQEVGAILLQMSKSTPWDLMPLIGATALLNYA